MGGKLALAALLVMTAGPASGDQVTVFAAASLREAVDRIASDWQARTGQTAVLSYAGSSALARQIQDGAPADLVILASRDWMDALAESGDLRSETRRDLASNRLVLVAGQEIGAGIAPHDMDADLDITGLLAGGRLSMALVDSVPAGIYGKEALRHLGMWDEVAPSVAQSDNVRAALFLVARGEAPLGIVYATDALAEPLVSVVGTFPSDSHDAITYSAALTAGSSAAAAADLLDYMGSDSARMIWDDLGFLPIGEGP